MASPEKAAEYKKIAEAALFTSGKAMSAEELAGVLGVASIGYVKNLMNELTGDYEGRDGALAISKIGDKYILGVREPYIQKVNSLAGSPDITRGALRILAYVGKNEPVMQNNVVKAFGTSTYDHVKELVEKDFVRTMHVGRTKRIETTQKFKEYFNF